MYKIPSQYFFRLHHVRPRFKNEVENVLGYVSFGIASTGRLPKDSFNAEVNNYIRSYGSNANVVEKTINNWRTEIAALFGLYNTLDGFCFPTYSCTDLANNTNLERFFRNFIFSFQYPGGHLKSNFILEIVKKGIKFHPGRWLATFFLHKREIYITKAEFCHCAYHDLRVTRDHEPVSSTYKRIQKNRQNNIDYDTAGDTIRYAGDILDYMVLGGFLLVNPDGKYYINPSNKSILEKLKKSDFYFDGYDSCEQTNPAVNKLEYNWVKYTDSIYEKLCNEIQDISVAVPAESAYVPETLPPDREDTDTAETGSIGENLVYSHEILRIKAAGREDLIHLIKRMPTHLAVGYDIKSVEALTEELRAIEVKTSVSQVPLSFNRFHLTTNEWRVAEDLGDKYFVYRLKIDREGYTLFIIQNPVRKYKQDVIKMISRDGADIVFTDQAGSYEELLRCAH